jgi:hypothetical protein
MITHRYSIEVSILKMIKEKINESAIVVCKVLKPIKILTIIKFHQLLLQIRTALDTCMGRNIMITVA